MQKANNLSDAGISNFANLKRLVYFAAVAETGSFTAAAERLGITKAVVSQQVARLERELGTTLLTRTTRKVTPTEAGKLFHRRCVLILKEAGEAFNEMSEVAAAPSGTLRLTAPLDYGITTVVPAIASFIRHYPQCKVDAVLRDQSIDVGSGEVELAIRVGWLTDPNVQARQIGTFQQLLVAAPSWRERLEPVREPEDIHKLPFVANTALRDPRHWHFTSDTERPQSIAVQPVIALDATLAVREAVCLGMGLSVLPDYAVADDLAAGRLLRVLPDWRLAHGGIHAVFPTARFRPAKVRAFVELLIEQEQARKQAGH